MIKKVSTFLLSFFFMMCFTISYGQSGPGLPGENPADLPIDGGLIYLLIGGLIFGIYKVKKK